MNKLIVIISFLFLPTANFVQDLELEYEFLFDITATLDNPIEIGKTLFGE